MFNGQKSLKEGGEGVLLRSSHTNALRCTWRTRRFLASPLADLCDTQQCISLVRTMKLLLGLNRLHDNLQGFIRQGEQYVGDAARFGAHDFCMREASLIRRLSDDLVPPINSLHVALDVGGTHTKAAMAYFTSSENPEWRVLFDRDNLELSHGAPGESPIECFCKRISAQLADALRSAGFLTENVHSLSLIWSNQLRAALMSNPVVRGVTGLITGITAGTYRKSEWFVSGLSDGYDLGSLFLKSVGTQGLRPAVFLVGNDTVFTLTALPGSHGGVVASSGANCTDVGIEGAERGLIFNTELGSLFKIAPSYLSEADVALVDRVGVSLALEDLISGNWLPRLLDEHVVVAAKSGVSELQQVADSILAHGSYCTTRDIAALLRGNRLAFPEGLSERSLLLMRELSSHLVTRAGVAAGALCYFSLFNQICSGQDFLTVALDSAMARHLPGYFEALEQTLQYLLARKARQGRVVLLKPAQLADGHEISVPVQGAILAGALWK